MDDRNEAGQLRESPLYPLLNEINKGAENGLPLIAITAALALPDICVSLASDDGRSTGERYREWCRHNLANDFAFVTPEDLWSMRCGVLHNGRFGDLQHSVARVIFPLAGQFGNCLMNDAYVYDPISFCRAMTNACFNWFEGHRQEVNIMNNIDRLMQYRRQGFPPYIGGVPVIA